MYINLFIIFILIYCLYYLYDIYMILIYTYIYDMTYKSLSQWLTQCWQWSDGMFHNCLFVQRNASAHFNKSRSLIEKSIASICMLCTQARDLANETRPADCSPIQIENKLLIAAFDDVKPVNN